MSRSADFIAELEYLTTEEGGRVTPVHSGCRPQLKFAFAEMQTSGRQIFVGRDLVYPGEKVLAEITIIAVPFFAGKLYSGLQFEFREGARIIGSGIITDILNKDLER